MRDREEKGVHDRSLRRQAEERLARQAHGKPAEPGRDPAALIHELQVHQIELEMQNEELRRAKQETEEQRLRYQNLYDFAPVGYLTLDAAGKVTAANLVAASLVGWERANLVGHHLAMFLAQESIREYQLFLRRLLAGASGVRCEIQLGTNAKREGWLLLDGSTGADVEAGESGRVTLTDITERKRLEEQAIQAREAAEAASRAKGQFLANMGHELRTPLTGVLGMLELALGEELSPELRHWLETAADSARSLLQLLNDILDMTMIEAGKLFLVTEPFPLRQCVTDVIDLLIPEARHKGLNLVLSVQNDLPEIVAGDRQRLQQLLMNLVGNAVKFTERGHVTATVTAGKPVADGKREFTFTVADTGIGIPTDRKESIFQIFTQADVSDTRRFGGAGLGLSICKELVALMGGTISFSSKEGMGSTFSFTVPLDEVHSVT